VKSFFVQISGLPQKLIIVLLQSINLAFIFCGAITVEATNGTRIMERCNHSAFAHAVITAWLVAPRELNPLAALVSLQVEHIRNKRSLDEFGMPENSGERDFHLCFFYGFRTPQSPAECRQG